MEKRKSSVPYAPEVPARAVRMVPEDGALRMGVLHGAYCLGCCWLLFVILFPLGIMKVAAMVVITLIIFAEKTLRLGPPGHSLHGRRKGPRTQDYSRAQE